MLGHGISPLQTALTVREILRWRAFSCGLRDQPASRPFEATAVLLSSPFVLVLSHRVRCKACSERIARPLFPVLAYRRAASFPIGWFLPRMEVGTVCSCLTGHWCHGYGLQLHIRVRRLHPDIMCCDSATTDRVSIPSASLVVRVTEMKSAPPKPCSPIAFSIRPVSARTTLAGTCMEPSLGLQMRSQMQTPFEAAIVIQRSEGLPIVQPVGTWPSSRGWSKAHQRFAKGYNPVTRA